MDPQDEPDMATCRRCGEDRWPDYCPHCDPEDRRPARIHPQDEIVALRRANDDLAAELGAAEDTIVDLVAELDSLTDHLDLHHPDGVCLDVDVAGDALLDSRRDDAGRPPG